MKKLDFIEFIVQPICIGIVVLSVCIGFVHCLVTYPIAGKLFTIFALSLFLLAAAWLFGIMILGIIGYPWLRKHDEGFRRMKDE